MTNEEPKRDGESAEEPKRSGETNEEPKRSGEFTVHEPKREPGDLPKMDFTTFALSLATSAMVYMGLAPAPGGEAPPEPNLALARQTIDALEMLQEKTAGNLDEAETQLLQSILYELRMGFVKAKGQSRA